MSKIIINSKVSSSFDTNVIKDKKAIKKDNIISYIDDKTKVSIFLEKDSIFLSRENEEIKFKFEFNMKNITKSKYYIKKLNNYLNVSIKTKNISINDNSFIVVYDLYLDEEKSDTFTYELEWRCLN